jgi:alcohol dehydrogenase YqhD (iron-dependent ADH family)
MRELNFGNTSLIMGQGSIQYLKEIDAKRVFIVTGGKSMFKNGTIETVESIFK